MSLRHPVSITLVAVCIAFAALLLFEAYGNQQEDEIPPKTVQGMLSQAKALAMAQEELRLHVADPTVVLAEARLTTMGQFESITGSPEGAPESGTNRSLGIRGTPVWVVVIGVAENLSHTEFIPAGDDMRQTFLGEAGDGFVWPDGTTRAVMAFDAESGTLLENLILAPAYAHVYDKIQSLPSLAEDGDIGRLMRDSLRCHEVGCGCPLPATC